MTSRLVVSEEGVSYGGPQKLRPALGELSGVVGDREPMNVELFVVNSVDEFSLSRRSVNPWGVGTRAPRRPVPLDGVGRDGNNHRRPYPVRVWEGSASTTRGLSPPTVRQGRRHIMSSFTLWPEIAGSSPEVTLGGRKIQKDWTLRPSRRGWWSTSNLNRYSEGHRFLYICLQSVQPRPLFGRSWLLSNRKDRRGRSTTTTAPRWLRPQDLHWCLVFNPGPRLGLVSQGLVSVSPDFHVERILND